MQGDFFNNNYLAAVTKNNMSEVKSVLQQCDKNCVDKEGKNLPPFLIDRQLGFPYCHQFWSY
jgi:hypothetical protein